MFDLWLLLFQVIFSTVAYFSLCHFDPIIAQGTFITIIAPTAAAAIAVSLILGANVTTMTTYLISCNLMVAIAAPLSFTWMSSEHQVSFFDSFLAILGKVFPLLIIPFFIAFLLQLLWPRANMFIKKHKNLSFYTWAVSLTIVISRSIGMIIEEFQTHRTTFLWMVLISMILCAIQFAVGKNIGKRYGDKVAGGQALGQKNTVLAIWMSQMYLNPLSSVIPTLYVIWQNLYNSYQMIQHERKDRLSGVNDLNKTRDIPIKKN